MKNVVIVSSPKSHLERLHRLDEHTFDHPTRRYTPSYLFLKKNYTDRNFKNPTRFFWIPERHTTFASIGF